jgi:hypothetical protein
MPSALLATSLASQPGIGKLLTYHRLFPKRKQTSVESVRRRQRMRLRLIDEK